MTHLALARKYRPQTLAEVVGQNVTVRILTNAIATNRVAHAFMLTGVRGVGKTTIARIIARSLTCETGPTVTPCGTCIHCQSIAEDHHTDIVELDAASRTGVDDMRHLIDGVRYRPVSARYKIFIIDEVHMLSKNAFNALLKTLEEPPPDVKFVFATTEVHRVPVTVLSRCQRFALRRVSIEDLIGYYHKITEAEGAQIEPEALRMIANAADGSVRDGLSILDQAIAASPTVTAEAVRNMIGVSDRLLIWDLFEALAHGDAGSAVEQFGRLYSGGMDPLLIFHELMEATHLVSRMKVITSPDDPHGDATRVRQMVAQLSIPLLMRLWQMLLKGIGEIQAAPVALSAAEIMIVRISYASTLPLPADLIREVSQS